MAKTNATQRTLKHLRDEGWSCHIVEKYIKYPGMPFGKRIDAFGIGDILACKPGITEPCATCKGTGFFTFNLADGRVIEKNPCNACHMSGKYVKQPGQIALVQCFPDTGGTGFADHRAKILAITEAEIWIRSGGKIFLQGWRKGGPRGRVKGWQMKQEEVVLA